MFGFFGGQRWIRTIEDESRRIYSPLHLAALQSTQVEPVVGIEPTTVWLQVRCSTIEPHRQVCPDKCRSLVPRGGIEPPTLRFSVSCSTDWATEASVIFCKKNNKKYWRPRTGSNRRPPAWQAGALTNWATGPWIFLNLLVGLHGLEPRTNRLWAGRSNQLS